jgi:ABC-type polysaccharide/polyol phosphate transport system ATPase subunit
VINDVNLEIYSNHSLGIVGGNGAGKTTLLRLLAAIYAPVSGEIFVNGRITTMFDSGYGLDLESDAVENIKLRGLLLARNKMEITTAIEEIREFVDLGTKWKEPLRTYSSGMISRIVIGLATAFKSEILLMDEGVGTSDISFQRKSSDRFRKLLKETGTIVMATHNQELMESFCDKAILMKEGRIVEEGKVSEIWTAHRKASQT